ncbi:hypothetical protein KZJ38_07450 [Paraburkholderia edwinii]|jgi:hypothetical protein|uniref:Uncharacterized protein n=1 Tax=Paraburkholderia edwinii TaxID=2861782 RepID=A0ABX8UT24_9BURK|nr:hypothetical protein [Paraburkholderia edwinii]QYD70134.1 hypothetical protein KZJ38_07450 [Paraburkholderia edwinii]
MGPTAAFLLIVWWSQGVSLFETTDKLTCWEAENAIQSVGAPVDKMVCVPMKEV